MKLPRLSHPSREERQILDALRSAQSKGDVGVVTRTSEEGLKMELLQVETGQGLREVPLAPVQTQPLLSRVSTLVLITATASTAVSGGGASWTDVNGSFRTTLDLRSADQARLTSFVTAITAGAPPGLKFRIAYSFDNTTWQELAKTSGTGDFLATSPSSNGFRASQWFQIAEKARDYVYLRIEKYQGTGSEACTLRGLSLQYY